MALSPGAQLVMCGVVLGFILWGVGTRDAAPQPQCTGHPTSESHPLLNVPGPEVEILQAGNF